MYGGVIKVHNMFEVNNKAPVCLKKTVLGKLFQPVIHIMNRVKVLTGSMYNYFSPLSFLAIICEAGNEYTACFVSTGILSVMEL